MSDHRSLAVVAIIVPAVILVVAPVVVVVVPAVAL